MAFDVLTKKQRSYCMSKISSRNTYPEIVFRKLLWRFGYHYRIKNKLPGHPDLIFSKLKIAIFIDGCFWHKCAKHFVEPKTRKEFWEKKISANVERDKKNNKKLNDMGWTVIRIWEHEIKDDLQGAVDEVVKVIERKKKSQAI